MESIATFARPNRKPRLQADWATLIPEESWRIYLSAIACLRKAELRFMLGGGFAMAAYTGRWRDTKDIDFYIHPRDRDQAVSVLNSAGFSDYFSIRPYVRSWIYRATQHDFIVDVIWRMANDHAEVDFSWFERAPVLQLLGEMLPVLPLEELIWCKTYVLQRDRCDWPDIFNLFYARGPELDWKYLMARLESDAPLLAAQLTVYRWLCPEASAKLPPWLWQQLTEFSAEAQHGTSQVSSQRIRLLDTRRWFAGEQPPGTKLEL